MCDLVVADLEAVDYHYGPRNLIKASDKLTFHNAFRFDAAHSRFATVDVYLPSEPYRPGKPT